MIARAKSVAARSWSCSKISKAPVTPGLRPGYDQVTTRLRPGYDLPATVKCENRGQVVERTYDWSPV